MMHYNHTNYQQVFRILCYIGVAILFVACYIPGLLLTSPWFEATALAPLFVWIPWTIAYLLAWFLAVFLLFGFLAYRQYRLSLLFSSQPWPGEQPGVLEETETETETETEQEEMPDTPPEGYPTIVPATVVSVVIEE